MDNCQMEMQLIDNLIDEAAVWGLVAIFKLQRSSYKQKNKFNKFMLVINKWELNVINLEHVELEFWSDFNCKKKVFR